MWMGVLWGGRREEEEENIMVEGGKWMARVEQRSLRWANT